MKSVLSVLSNTSDAALCSAFSHLFFEKKLFDSDMHVKSTLRPVFLPVVEECLHHTKDVSEETVFALRVMHSSVDAFFKDSDNALTFGSVSALQCFWRVSVWIARTAVAVA